MECDVQNKLLIIWEILRIPAQIRLSFMAKYSSQVYAAEMGHAVDTWGAAAVLSILLLETLLVLKKMQVCFNFCKIILFVMLDMFTLGRTFGVSTFL